MDEQRLDSDVLRSVQYDRHSAMLFVTFHNGKRYLYENVPQMRYEELLKAQSAGKYFNQQISHKFKSRIIG